MRQSTRHTRLVPTGIQIVRALLMLATVSLLTGCGGMFGKVSIDPNPAPRPRAAQGEYHPVVKTVEQVLGTPYKWGGASPREGFDCSGLVHWAFAEHGVNIPRVSWEQVNHGQRVGWQELRSGDLVFFDTGQRRGFHVGLATGRGSFLHSPKAGSHVSETSLMSSYWHRRFMFGRRVVDPQVLAER